MYQKIISLPDKISRNERFEKVLFDIVTGIARNGEGKISVVNYEAHNFVMLNGRLLGGDIVSYGEMVTYSGEMQTLNLFFDQIIKPLKHELPDAYSAAIRQVRSFLETLDGASFKLLQHWRMLD